MSEPVEMSDGKRCEWAGNTHMGVALPRLSVEPTRVQTADVEAAQKCFPAIHDQQLSVVALEVPQGMPGAKRSEPTEPDSAAFHLTPELPEAPLAGAEGI
jgi:hypothetical protein